MLGLLVATGTSGVSCVTRQCRHMIMARGFGGYYISIVPSPMIHDSSCKYAYHSLIEADSQAIWSRLEHCSVPRVKVEHVPGPGPVGGAKSSLPVSLRGWGGRHELERGA